MSDRKEIVMTVNQADMVWNDDVAVKCRVRPYRVHASRNELRQLREAYRKNIAEIDKKLINEPGDPDE